MSEIKNLDDFHELAERALAPAASKGDLALFRKELENYPEFIERTCNMTWQAIRHFIDTVDSTPGAGDVVKASVKEFQRGLGVGSSPPIEDALAQHATLCWLRLMVVEQKYTNIIYGRDSKYTTEVGEYWERRLGAAQHRFLRAMDALARVRKMQLPPIQVNIAGPGGQQVNVMGKMKVKKGGS